MLVELRSPLVNLKEANKALGLSSIYILRLNWILNVLRDPISHGVLTDTCSNAAFMIEGGEVQCG